MNASNCPLYESCERTLEKVEHISQLLETWLCADVDGVPTKNDVSALKGQIDEIKYEIRDTRDQIQERERLGSSSSWSSGNGEDNITTIKQSTLKKWKYIGHGAFSVVFRAQHHGFLAIKLLQPEKIGSEHEEAFAKEMQLMSILRHDNVVAFRYEGNIETDTQIDGWCLKKDQMFFAMEFLPNNLKKYVMSRATHENKGLPESISWDFAAQLARGLAYLHNLKVAHRDLKPDNILINPGSQTLKISDFGEAYKRHQKENSRYLCARYAAPEMWQYINELNDPKEDKDYTEMFIRADVYAYGNIVAFCTMGIKPWDSDRTEIINEAEWDPSKAKIELPKRRPDSDHLKSLIMHCYEDDPRKRPASASQVLSDHFTGDSNPYESNSNDTDFFTFGFLQDTKLYVADSLVKEIDEEERIHKPEKYSSESLICEIKLEQDLRIPEQRTQWEHYQYYCQKMRDFKELTESNEIKKDISVALKSLHIPLRGRDSENLIQLKFCETSYVHHRSMREIWRKMMSNEEKRNSVPCKRKVNEIFSTSFGLHVTVLTADKKILFFQRENAGTNANQGGLPGPGLFTCTVTKSVYKESYFSNENGNYVSLLHSAAYCLNEELNIQLSKEEQKVINFHTVYLKFDNHEWGMCGYIDLSDKRIEAKRRLTSKQIEDRYKAGKKTKHDHLFSIPFDPSFVASFMRLHLPDMASSTKMVAVKVLKAFFKSAVVEKEFMEK